MEIDENFSRLSVNQSVAFALVTEFVVHEHHMPTEIQLEYVFAISIGRGLDVLSTAGPVSQSARCVFQKMNAL